MKTVDLTHPITTNMPVYPGTEPPRITNPCTIEKTGFREKKLELYSHTGTHMDGPSHILPRGTPLDALPVECFFGPATVLDLSARTMDRIGPGDLQLPAGEHLDYVLLYTGWYHKWGRADYFTGYPVLTAEAAAHLASRRLKGIGTDTMSVDPVGTTDFTVHKIFLQRNILIIENLTNLAKLVGKTFTLYCFPLKFTQADGSPVRAVAMCD